MSIDLNAAVSQALKAEDPEVTQHLQAYGITTQDQRWAALVAMAEAAACAAKAEWLLVNKAGKPHTTGGTWWDGRKRPPYPGFHLSYGVWDWDEGDEERDPQRVYYTRGQGFPLTKAGLEAALRTADDLTSIPGTTRVEVRIAWGTISLVTGGPTSARSFPGSPRRTNRKTPQAAQRVTRTQEKKTALLLLLPERISSRGILRWVSLPVPHGASMGGTRLRRVYTHLAGAGDQGAVLSANNRYTRQLFRELLGSPPPQTFS